MKTQLYYVIILIILTISCTSQTSETKNGTIKPSPRYGTITRYSVSARTLYGRGIPDSVFEMTNLKCLTIISEPYHGIKKYKNDTHVNTNCRICEISPKIKNLQNLEELNLNLSAFDTFPKEIAECKKLKVININCGTIENIDILTKLTNLEKLSLEECYISKLPDNIGQMTKLKILDLTATQVDDAELLRVKKALPNCDVIYYKY